MLRFYFLITRSFFLILYYVPKMEYYARNRERYGEKKCYDLVLKVLDLIDHNARVVLTVKGEERLPKEGGYIMYANHQGRYDALGILHGHKEPASVLIAKKRSRALILNQFIDLVNGPRLDKEDMRAQVQCIQEVITRVKAGERVLIFPEGQYADNGNKLQEFHAGSFKCAQRAKCPIVPVVLFDSYLVFTVNSLRKAPVYVEFLEPIPYEDYKYMTSAETAALVKGAIEYRIQELEKEKQR